MRKRAFSDFANNDLVKHGAIAAAEKISGAACNSCLLNLYHDGGEGIGWHSDDERSLAPGAPILSMSFGAERKFSFRHKHTKETITVTLENGSLLVCSFDLSGFPNFSGNQPDPCVLSQDPAG